MKKFFYEIYTNYLSEQIGYQADCLYWLAISPRDSFTYAKADLAYNILDLKIEMVNLLFEKTMKRWEKEL